MFSVAVHVAEGPLLAEHTALLLRSCALSLMTSALPTPLSARDVRASTLARLCPAGQPRAAPAPSSPALAAHGGGDYGCAVRADDLDAPSWVLGGGAKSKVSTLDQARKVLFVNARSEHPIDLVWVNCDGLEDWQKARAAPLRRRIALSFVLSIAPLLPPTKLPIDSVHFPQVSRRLQPGETRLYTSYAGHVWRFFAVLPSEIGGTGEARAWLGAMEVPASTT